GEILGLIGPNGAGKSTMFNLICGALPLTHGTIAFCGESIAGRSAEAIARLGIARTCWNVRAMPRRAMASALRPAIDSPQNAIVPWVNGSAPQIRLNIVLLPAPLGPISPRISP